MDIPIFVLYELIIRLADYDPSIGEYRSHKKEDSGITLITTGRRLLIPNEILEKQFKDPGTVSMETLQKLLVPAD